jgi:hypothetical protein
MVGETLGEFGYVIVVTVWVNKVFLMEKAGEGVAL